MADVRRLAFPGTDTWGRQLRATCHVRDSGVFFRPEGERRPSRAVREAKTERVCATCPVAQLCPAHTPAVQEPYGVCGGLSAEERAAELRSGPARRRAAARVVWPAARVRVVDRPSS